MKTQRLKTQRLLDAFTHAIGVTVLAGIATTGYGVVTGDYTQVIPATAFSFVTAMGTAARYERKRETELSVTPI